MAYTPAFPIKCYRCMNVIVEPDKARVLDTGDNDSVVVCDDEPSCDQRAIVFAMEEIDALRRLMQSSPSAPTQKHTYTVLTSVMDRLRLVLNETGEKALSQPRNCCLLCFVQMPETQKDSVLCRFCRTV